MGGDIVVGQGATQGGDGGPQELVPDAAWTLVVATVVGMLSTLSLTYLFRQFGGSPAEG